MKLSVIIPVFNEESTIEEILKQVEAVDIPKEIIVVDDASTDKTEQIVEKIAQNSPIIFCHSEINRGKGAAVRLGFEKVKGDIVIIQDADLELDPTDYPRLVNLIMTNKAAVVYGSRFLLSNKRISFLIYCANKFLVFITNLLFNTQLTDMETGYKVFRADILPYLKLQCQRFDFEPEITANFLKLGYKIYEVPISYNPRSSYEGKKINWKDGFMALYTLIRCRFYLKIIRKRSTTKKDVWIN